LRNVDSYVAILAVDDPRLARHTQKGQKEMTSISSLFLVHFIIQRILSVCLWLICSTSV
jgi:hypothetical protein